jgi:Methylase involved in ubiquinone/menaquinone biosynthesis
MSWDPVWEDIFRQRASWGKYPGEEFIRFIAPRFYGAPDRGRVAMLELGCGPGGGPGWYLAREGFNYHGLDASPTALAKGRARFAEEGLPGRFVRGFFDQLPFADASFDCVYDVAALQCNAQDDARRIVAEVLRVLKPGGWHFSFTAMAGCLGDGDGERLDPLTLRNVSVGPFAGMGVMRFATRESLLALYAGFEDLDLGYTIRSLPRGAGEIRDWVVSCRKKEG